MKMKSLATLGLGVIASSFISMAPAIAADSNLDNADGLPATASDPGFQNLTMNNNISGGMDASSLNGPSANDDGSPDTATGDDDY